MSKIFFLHEDKNADLMPLFEEAITKFTINVMCDDPDISDVRDIVKNIVYGFISKKDGRVIDDREWIHNCKDLRDVYDYEMDPEKTLKNKLGLCLDQSIAIKHLMSKMHPDMPVKIFALTKGRFGHAVPTYENKGKYYYFENAWDKEKGLHGPFDSEGDLRMYLSYIYHKNHDKDNNDEVTVTPYDEYFHQEENSERGDDNGI